MTETEAQKKKRLESKNAIDLRDMVNQRKLKHGQVVVDGEGEDVIENKMVHTFNRRDRRKAIHQDKINKRQENERRNKRK